MEIINLKNELERIRSNSKDVVTSTKLITAIEDGGTLKLDLKERGAWPLTRHGGNQLAEKCDIPQAYFHKMLENGKAALAAENVNGWLSEQADRRLVRLADGQIRAILSDRYRPMDNYDLAFHVLDRVKAHGASVLDSQLTETRMYVKVTVPNYREQVIDNDTVFPGLVVSNSEVGAGAFRVEPFVFRLVCRNGLIRPADGFQKVHIGGQLQDGEFRFSDFYRDETLRAKDAALWHEVRDVIDATFKGDILKRQIAELRGATEIEIKSPTEATNAVARDLTFSEERKLDLLRYFAKEGEKTEYDLVNAITAVAQSYENYDDRISVERYAGQHLTNALQETGYLSVPAQ